jgi:hypothetical protein
MAGALKQLMTEEAMEMHQIYMIHAMKEPEQVIP